MKIREAGQRARWALRALGLERRHELTGQNRIQVRTEIADRHGRAGGSRQDPVEDGS
ncbi:MAG: hypothetical protein FJZ00_10775 [Candidatus Sericytochromatia bacterium]|uniref:Uncharacterized protein n=1 Tax=Candidatus Tanganyikabacteria bacterium TaxID=2961651 RepID=A0A938BNY3_9BACT|nr:hypothetical protein [Candidatus Tanganyikabacteria bacterium]